MIKRIVKLSFREDFASEFPDFFQSHRSAIAAFPGCTHLELLQDLTDPGVFFTLSHWSDTASLENYRKSDLFNGIWSKVSEKFSSKPEAWSLKTL
jgi:quinol monooxygenase YgiN